MKKKKHPVFNVLAPSRGGAVKKRILNRDSWRRPRGIDNKKRIKKKWAGARPKIGYKNPEAIRGLHPSGLSEVLVHNPKELEGLRNVVIRIAGSVGRKKRLEIMKKAEELGLRVLNPVRGEGK